MRFKAIIIGLFPICLMSCRGLNFYGEAERPVFYSSIKGKADTGSTDSLNVVTFNIKKARKIQLAITEMKQLEKKTPVDIYLLQEMDEKGVEAIATGLGLNYLYFPIAYDKSEKKNIGTAILSRGTLARPEKLILPHAKWQNRQRRSVTIGEVTLSQKKILVYSVHTETVAMSRKKRMDQVDSIIHYVQQESSRYKYVLIGGDFNTVFPRYSRSVINKFHGIGFDWATSNAGGTARAMMGLARPINDYLFSRGFLFRSAHAIRSSRSSDHYPVFATLGF